MAPISFRPLRGAARRLGVGIALATVALAVAGPSPAGAAVTCDRVAATSGSDSAAGTVAAPYRTAQKLVDSLSAGQTGCLRAGTFTQDVKFSHGGASGAPLTLTSFPGERALLVGRMWIARGSDFVTVTGLDLDGTNSAVLPSPTITANDAVFTDNDVTNHNQTICFVVGNDTYGYAARTLIQRNRIHHCGVLPAANHDHGIYVSNATDTQVLDNVIYANADRGVQMYPDAKRTTVQRNVIDGNGQGVLFSGSSGSASIDNLVSNNVITNAKLRYNIESYWGGPVGTGNVANNNCVWNGHNGNIGDQKGFTATDNLVADPQYANPGAGDFRIPDANPCAKLLAGAPLSSLGVTPPAPTPPTAAAAAATPPAPRPAPSTGAPAPRPQTTPRSPVARTAVPRLSVKVRRSGRRVVVQGRIASRVSRNLRLAVDVQSGGGWRTAATGAVRTSSFQTSVSLGSAARSSLVGVRVRVQSLGQRVVWLRVG
jgi:parallel beta-helix repeat protein